MSRRPGCWLLASVVVLGFSSAFSQSKSSILRLEEAFRLVKRNNLSLQQMEKSIERARLEMKIQRSNFLPTFSATASYNHVSELAELELPFQWPGIQIPPIVAGVKDQYDLALVITQPLFTGFRTRNLVKASRRQFRATQQQREVVKHQLFFQVGQLYTSIQLNLVQQRVLEQSAMRADVALQKIRNFFRAQQAIGYDTLIVANRKLEILNQVEKLKKLRSLLRTNLRYLLNVDRLGEIPLPEIQEKELVLQDLQVYFQLALANRPEMKQYAELSKARSLQQKVVQASYFPQILARATYHYARPGVNFFQNKWMDYYTVGLDLHWELWNWNRTRRQSQQSALDAQQLNLKTRELIQTIEKEVNEAYQYLLHTREQIQLQRRLLRQEQERYRITRKKFSQGLTTTLDLNDAENKLTQAELLLQKSFIEWLRYRLQLDYATGVIGK